MSDSDLKNALPAGTVLHLYTIDQVLGHGGFGIVYRAQHAELGVVAIKEYLPPDLAVRDTVQVHPLSENSKGNFEEGLRRFVEEAKQLVQFNHPNIIRCRDFLRCNGTAYLIMDFEEGLPLSDLLSMRQQRNMPLTEEEILHIIVPILEGLRIVHDKGVLHRDIKPGNIFIRRKSEQPVLLDFGAAKQNFSEHSKSMAPYSPGFAAIEQIEDSGNLGPWTDIYAIGAVMWRIIADRNPPKVESRMSAATRGKPDPLQSSLEIGAGRFSENLLRTIDKCLQLNEEDRFQSAGELIRTLNQSGPIPERKAPLQEPAAKAVPQPEPKTNKQATPVPEKRESEANSSKLPYALVGLAFALVIGTGAYYISSQPEPVTDTVSPVVVPPVPGEIVVTPAPDTTPAEEVQPSGTAQLVGTFVTVPAGSFQMGDETGNGNDREHPTRTVQIAAFDLADTEVTRGQFARFVDAMGYRTEAETNAGSMTGCHAFEAGSSPRWDARAGFSWRSPGFTQTDDHPVVCVSYNDAVAYIEWLNTQNSGTYRLPSEAEWEYAIRANSATNRGLPFARLDDACLHGNIADRTALPNGNVWNNRADCADNVAVGTSPVKRYRANSLSIHDLVGNVSEWTSDCWHETYEGAPTNGGSWSANGDCTYRVLRGSSWNGDPADVTRAAYRSAAARTYRSSKFGIRLVRN